MLKENFPLVSAITLNWNNTEITCDFLRSIRELNTYPNLEVIVVDNGSKIDPAPALTEAYPSVKLIRNKTNLGFAAGNNVGLLQAEGDYFFIVNNDTEVTPGLIEGLVDIFNRHPDAGLVSPKFHYYFEKGTIEYAGYETVSNFTGRNGMVGCKEKDEGQYNEIKITHYAHGGGMMISRDVLEKVGLMPEDFFLYYEELDWGEQVKRHGYQIYYQPKSLIYHKESMTNGKDSPLKTYYLTRNRILFMRRNKPLRNYMLFLAYFSLFTIPKNTFSFLYKGKKEHLRLFWRGILWHFNRKFTI